MPFIPVNAISAFSETQGTDELGSIPCFQHGHNDYEAALATTPRTLEVSKSSTQPSNNSQKNLYARRKANNICISCGVFAPEANKASCQHCLENSRKRFRQMRAEKKANRICQHCSTSVEGINRTTCLACRKKIQDAYRKRRSQNICIVCRKVPAEDGLSACTACKKRRE